VIHVLLAVALAAAPRIEWASQRLTVVATGESLPDLIRELCGAAGVTLRGNVAPGPRVSVNMRDATFEAVVRRVLDRYPFVLRYPRRDGAVPVELWISGSRPTIAEPPRAADRTEPVVADPKERAFVEALQAMESAPDWDALPEDEKTRRKVELRKKHYPDEK
jgi:hypothetical protein